MAKLLFIAYSFPPNSLPGAIRAWNMVKQLSAKGWQVTVVTPRPDYWRSGRNTLNVECELEDLGVKRIFTSIGMPFLDNVNIEASGHVIKKPVERVLRLAARKLGYEPQVGWIKGVIEACESLQEGEYDLVLATGSPFVSFSLAKRLAERLNANFVVDYRDLWNGNPHEHRWLFRGRRKLERTILSHAAAITVIGPTMKECIADTFGGNERIHVIPNGFDGTALANVPAEQFDHFAIGYGGIFYPPTRSITPLFEALRSLDISHTRNSWRFHYWGPQSDYVLTEAEKAHIMHRVELHGAVGHAKSLSLTAGVDLSVVITSVNDSCGKAERGIVTSKLFEAIGLGTPVLLISPADGDASSFLIEADAGCQFSGVEVEAMTQYLSKELAKQRYRLMPAETFSWAAIGKKLDEVLRRVCDDKSKEKVASEDTGLAR